VDGQLAGVGPNALGEAELFADEVAVRALAEILRTLGAAPVRLELGERSDPPETGTRLTWLVMSASDGLVQINLAGPELRITGSAERLAEFATFLEQFVKFNDIADPGEHVHVSFGWDEGWLAPEAVELVIAGPNPG